MPSENISGKRVISSRLALLCITLIWGTSFVILKNTLDSLTTFYLMAYRFTGAGLVMLTIGLRNIKLVDREYLVGGVFMGLVLFCAYALQTFGLVYTTPGVNAFLTAVYCVIVPFLYWFVSKKKPDKYNITAALVCFCGMGFVSVRGDLSIGLGEILTALCGFFFAIHIILTVRYAEGRSAVLLNAVQLLTVAALSWIAALIFEERPAALQPDIILSMLYLALMCTAVCFFLQTYGQKYTPPSSVAVIMTLESVFGATFSVIFYNERLDGRLLIGFSLIFVAILISETKMRFVPELKKL